MARGFSMPPATRTPFSRDFERYMSTGDEHMPKEVTLDWREYKELLDKAQSAHADYARELQEEKKKWKDKYDTLQSWIIAYIREYDHMSIPMSRLMCMPDPNHTPELYTSHDSSSGNLVLKIRETTHAI